MPNTKSAKKALRASTRKKEFNVIRKNKIRNPLRELRRVVGNDKADYLIALNKAYSALDKAVKGKTIKKGKADRKKSRLAKMVKKVAVEAVSSI